MTANPTTHHSIFRKPADPGCHPRLCRSGLIWRILAVFACLIRLATAQTFGDFTYTDNGSTITISGYTTPPVGAIVIPSEIAGKPVTTLGSLAFANCAALTAVTIPTGVTTLGSQVFLNCTALTSVTLPPTVTSIGDSAFYSCIVLNGVTIPGGVTSIGNGVFDSCRALSSITIPAGVTSIGNNAFFNCNALASVTLPPSVTNVGQYAFGYCSELTSIEFPAGVTSIRFNALADCVKLTNVVLPAGLTTIEGSAFANCSSLASLSIPTTVTTIGTYAFYKCAALAALAIPSGVTLIGTSTFEDCAALASVTIPATVTNIGNNAFRNCGMLASITIPASVTSIAANVPASDTDVFGSCSSLTAIHVDAANPAFSSAGGVLFNKTKTTLISYPRGLAGAYSIPTTVTRIDDSAFRFCVAVTGIYIPSSVTAIDPEAFVGCSMLEAITVDSASANYSSLDGVLFNKTKTTLRAYPAKLLGSYQVPGGVTLIGTSAFRYCPQLTEVTVSSSVTSINATAFANCGLLTKATFTGIAPTTFGLNVFQNAAASFKIYYNAGASGFTTPTWKGYPSVEIGAISDWLVTNGLPANSDLNSDSNGDGVSLLMAYALNLNPNQNLSGSLPKPVFASNQMTLTFYAGASGVTYVVETCTNFNDWTTAGVSLTAPDTNQFRTATVARNGSSRYMRIKVMN